MFEHVCTTVGNRRRVSAFTPANASALRQECAVSTYASTAPARLRWTIRPRDHSAGVYQRIPGSFCAFRVSDSCNPDRSHRAAAVRRTG